MAAEATDLAGRIRRFYEGTDPTSVRFRYALLLFDLAVIAFLVASSFFHGSLAVEVLDAAIGAAILVDFAARLWISRNRWRDLAHPAGIADLIVIVSLLAPVVGENLAFLRVARSLRLLRSYQLLARLRRDYPFFRRNQDIVLSATHLFIFIFVMTALVFETQRGRNPAIANYVDALYFTITTLTTTGFGDITLPGTVGRLLSVMIMIFGVSLFLRLIQVLFRPQKIHFACRQCGLDRHDSDSIHCKHCGALLNIPHHGSE
ncbi:MAG: potassium channel family protein [Alphaproteobacteria bacterium]|nr:potassium channel family protein [Alphaproteobacteria bacterium]